MKRFLALAIATAALGVQAASAEPQVDKKQDAVAFNASVRVEVDAAGKPVKVEASADLPQAIRAFIEKRVASWQYEPAKQGGVAVAATTYVKVGACAMPTPAGDAFRLGLDFKGNGPSIANRYSRLMPPPYPQGALIRGVTGAFAVVLDVARDGSAEASSIEPIAGASLRALREFEPTLRKWAREQRYLPETVAGQAVATQIRVPVEFSLAPDDREELKRELRQQTLSTSECQLAKGEAPGLNPVAINSPVKVTPVPAG